MEVDKLKRQKLACKKEIRNETAYMLFLLVGPCKWRFKSHRFSSSQHTNHNSSSCSASKYNLITINAKRKRQNLERERRVVV